MRWVVLGVATLVAAASALLSGAASGPAPAPSAAQLMPVAAYVPATGSVSARILLLVNQHRERNGCARSLTANEALMISARRHSTRMASVRSLAHTLPGEPRLMSRIKGAGYGQPWLVAENIALGYGSADSVIRGWMNSTMHRKVLLDCRLRHVGVSRVTEGAATWWTLDLARR